MAKASFDNKKNIPTVAETPGFKPTPAPHVSDKGLSSATSDKIVPVKKVPNETVKTKLRASTPVGSKIGASVQPNTGTITKARPKKLMTAQATATAKKFNPPAGSVAKLTKPSKPVSAGATKPIFNQKPVYTTPGFKPAKKTSKK